jgi:hypothetical protein
MYLKKTQFKKEENILLKTKNYQKFISFGKIKKLTQRNFAMDFETFIFEEINEDENILKKEEEENIIKEEEEVENIKKVKEEKIKLYKIKTFHKHILIYNEEKKEIKIIGEKEFKKINFKESSYDYKFKIKNFYLNEDKVEIEYKKFNKEEEENKNIKKNEEELLKKEEEIEDFEKYIKILTKNDNYLISKKIENDYLIVLENLNQKNEEIGKKK